MLLTVDVGNTNIVLGGFLGDELKFVSRIQTCPNKMADEYAITINSVLRFHGFLPKDFDGAMISCVVPPLNPILRNAIGGLLNCSPLAICPGTRTGLNIKIDDPSTLGADFVATAVCALNRHKLPCVIIDLGTATKFSVVDENGAFLGGAIMPGVNLSLEALSKGTAMLPHIDFGGAANVVGKNSADCMSSGVVFGTASMIDGMLGRISDELGYKVNVVATGGLSKGIVPYCKTKIEIDENMILYGIKDIYDKNVKS